MHGAPENRQDAGTSSNISRRGRLTRYSQTTVVDTTPTGFAPADRLLAHIDNHPDHAKICADFGVPYLHLPVTPADLTSGAISLRARPSGINTVITFRGGPAVSLSITSE